MSDTPLRDAAQLARIENMQSDLLLRIGAIEYRLEVLAQEFQRAAVADRRAELRSESRQPGQEFRGDGFAQLCDRLDRIEALISKK